MNYTRILLCLGSSREDKADSTIPAGRRNLGCYVGAINADPSKAELHWRLAPKMVVETCEGLGEYGEIYSGDTASVRIES
jgi:hypothetical protein